MRKFLPIVLLAVLLLPLLAALRSGSVGDTANLPACCRRNGVHHCAMTMLEKTQLATADSSKGPRWSSPLERCPYCPAVVSWHSHDMLSPSPAQAIFAELQAHPSGTVQTESRKRIARDRSRQKRGPPALSLA